MPLPSELKYSRLRTAGPIWVVTINRPDVANALHGPANEELHQILTAFFSEKDALVAVLTGEGTHFCSGEDLAYEADHGPAVLPATGFAGLTERFGQKPVVAAVNGDATGAGFELALACDIVVASETAGFIFDHASAGRGARGGGVERLVRALPWQTALGILLTARRISAPEGVMFGFVNEMVAPRDLMRTANRWAREIAELSPHSIAVLKESAERASTEPSLRAAIAASRERAQGLSTSGDFAEGRRALLEGRRPTWTRE